MLRQLLTLTGINIMSPHELSPIQRQAAVYYAAATKPCSVENAHAMLQLCFGNIAIDLVAQVLSEEAEWISVFDSAKLDEVEDSKIYYDKAGNCSVCIGSSRYYDCNDHCVMSVGGTVPRKHAGDAGSQKK
jgi:hypothetical protein